MKINGHNFLLGADPEFFVRKDGQVVSAHGLVEGTKEAPYKVERGAVQVDGMALEFNIDPATDFSAFDESISMVLDQTMKMVPGYEMFVSDPHAILGCTLLPVAEFGAEYIAAQPKEAKELGCNPDYNAYLKGVNPTPNADAPFRTASGHIHIGWCDGVDPLDPTHLEACYALTKSLDVWLGAASLSWDPDNRRRQLYGKAGAFRPKPYGMEYRVLSNKWVTSPLLRKLVYWNTIEAIKQTFDNPDRWEGKLVEGKTIPQIINQEVENWNSLAARTLQAFGIRTPKWYRENEVK